MGDNMGDNMSDAYKLGQAHKSMGYSVHYNPYRHKGTASQFVGWKKGFLSLKVNDNPKA
jgi:hypothetical protein